MRAAQKIALTPEHFDMAKSAAVKIAQHMTLMPPEVQLGVAEMLFKATVMTNVRAEKRLQVFDGTVRSMRDEVKADLSKGSKKR